MNLEYLTQWIHILWFEHLFGSKFTTLKHHTEQVHFQSTANVYSSTSLLFLAYHLVHHLHQSHTKLVLLFEYDSCSRSLIQDDASELSGLYSKKDDSASGCSCPADGNISGAFGPRPVAVQH